MNRINSGMRLAIAFALLLGTLLPAGFGAARAQAADAAANVALHKTAVANGIFANDSKFAPSLAFDGNMDTVWKPTAYQAWKSPTEMADVESYIRVDLGKAYLIDRVAIRELGNSISAYKIEYSADNANWRSIASARTVGSPASVIESVLDSAVQGRYVKLTIPQAAAVPAIAEVEVYGKPASQFLRNIAAGKPASVSSAVYANSAGLANDGDAATAWTAANGTPQWLQIDLGKAVEFDQIVLKEPAGSITSYALRYSNNGSMWSTFKAGTKTAKASAAETIVKSDNPATARYVRLDIDGAAAAPSLSELEVYGRYAKVREAPKTIYTIEVGDTAALNQAMLYAIPGDSIVLKDGAWPNAQIKFSADASADKPVILRAQTPGKVVLTGASNIELNSPYLIVDGLSFIGDPALEPSGRNLVSMNSDYGRLTNITFDKFNPKDVGKRYAWVLLNGSYNRVDNNLFNGKIHTGPVVQQQDFGRRYNHIDHNLFKDMPKTDGANGREIIQLVGYGSSEELGDDGSYATVDNNLFYRADGESQETISVKSNGNIIRDNTVLETKGAISLRSGNHNTIERNIILGNSVEGTDGIRAAGQFHTIVNNYIADVERFGISLTIGDFIDDKLTDSWKPGLRTGTPLGRFPTYSQVKSGTISNNTIINTGRPGIWAWWKYKTSWPSAQRVMMPQDNQILGNIVTKTYSSSLATTPEEIAASPYAIYFQKVDTAPPLDRFAGQLKSNRWETNYAFSTVAGSTYSPVFFNGESSAPGVIATDPMLTLQDGLYRPAANSPAKWAGAKLIGMKPLTEQDVGPLWMRDASLKSLKVSGAELDPDFRPDVAAYKTEVRPDSKNVQIVPTASSERIQSIKVNGMPVASDATYSASLGDGKNSFAIEATAYNGVTKKLYTLDVYRGKEKDPKDPKDEKDDKDKKDK